MKYYKVRFAYSVNVAAENEDEAGIEARTTMLELFPLTHSQLDEFACDAEEDEELKKELEQK